MQLISKIIVVCLVSISNCYADEFKPRSISSPIPEPLSLSDALLFSQESHPRMSTAKSNIQSAINLKNEAEEQNNLNAFLEGRLSYIEPSPLSDYQSHDDHRAGIVVSKTLYDFGRNAANINSAEFGIKTQELNQKRIILERRLEIMQKFFDVLLADMSFYRYNEEMATAFIGLDRLRDRLELGQASDIDVMKQDVEYNRVRYLRIKSQNDQRITRAKLAVAMGRPDELAETVSKPVLNKIKLKLPDVELLQKIALKNNLKLKGLNSQLSAAKAKVDLARNRDNPTLNLEAGSYAYTRKSKSRDELQVGLVLRVPIFGGRKSDVGVAKALNTVHLIDADIALVRTNVSASILTQWLEFDSLKGKLLQMKALTDYREIYLDRSRGLYELEVKTDLGDAMVRVSEAEREYLKVQYEMMLAITKLEMDVGQDLYQDFNQDINQNRSQDKKVTSQSLENKGK